MVDKSDLLTKISSRPRLSTYNMDLPHTGQNWGSAIGYSVWRWTDNAASFLFFANDCQILESWRGALHEAASVAGHLSDAPYISSRIQA